MIPSIRLAMLLASTILGDGLSWHVDLDPGSLRIISTTEGDLALLDGASTATGPGMPALPGIPLSFILPPGAVLDSVTVTVLASVPVPGFHQPALVEIAGEDPSDPPPGEDTSGSLTSRPVTGRMTGFTIASFAFLPVRPGDDADPASLVTSADLRLHCSFPAGGPAPPVLSPGQAAAARLQLEACVANPWMAAVWSPPVREPSRELVSWVAIADESLAGVLQPLVEHRCSRGESGLLLTLQWIGENYAGWDLQEKLRNCLVDLYWNQGLVYAVLVGDSGPTARISSFIRSGEIPMNTFTDLYYADLDGNWDANGNHLYGEVDDGMDYYADIHVGRLPSDDPVEVAVMVSRIIGYEESPPGGSWRTTALLCGAGILPGLSIWGSSICMDVWEGFSSNWNAIPWFEDSTGVQPVHPGPLAGPIDEGCGYLEIAAHGSPEEVGWYFPPQELLSAGDALGLQNRSMTPVVRSLACNVGNIDHECLAEGLMAAPEGGAVAVMMNSSSGILFTSGQGPSELMDIYYPEILLEQGVDLLGIAHSVSRLWLIAAQGFAYSAQWVLQTLNFFGDPATRMVGGPTGVGGDPQPESPEALLSLAPSPAVRTCGASWSLPRGCGEADLILLDVSGRVIRTWEGIGDGEDPLLFDLVDASGSPLPAGCYCMVLRAPGIAIGTRLTVLGR